MTTPFDYVNSINSKKRIDIEDGYNKFLINRAFSYYPDTVSLANEINRFPNMDDDIHYNFLFDTISKGNRFSKWHKPKSHPDATAISQYFGISLRQAYSYLKIFDHEQLQQIHYELKIKEEQ